MAQKPQVRNLNFLVITWSPSALCIILILWKLGGFCSTEHQNSDLYENFFKLTKVKQSPHNRKLQLHQFDSTTLLYSHENTLLPLFTAYISQERWEISIHVALQTCSQLFRNINHHLNELPCSAPQLHNIQKEQIEASRCLFVQVLDLCKPGEKGNHRIGKYLLYDIIPSTFLFYPSHSNFWSPQEISVEAFMLHLFCTRCGENWHILLFPSSINH